MLFIFNKLRRTWFKGVRREKRRISYARMSYKEYLQTPYWKWLSNKIRRRDNFTCQKCGKHGWIVHHNYYPARGTEHQYRDCLITVCDKCHRRIHGKV